MDVKIWDDHNKQWLEPIAIFFGKDNTVWRITACKPNEDALTDGWYELADEDLKQIAIIGSINHNIELIPENEK